MSGAKGLNPHELAHRWVKELGTPTSYHTTINFIPVTGKYKRGAHI